MENEYKLWFCVKKHQVNIYKKYKNPGKSIIISACEQSIALNEIWPALPSTAVGYYSMSQHSSATANSNEYTT